jgi:Mce-associated membrane protein
MTGTLEAQMHPLAEDDAAREPAEKSSASKKSRSKTAGTKSTAKGSKSSRATSATKALRASGNGATTSGGDEGRAREDGSALPAQEVEEVGELSANGSAVMAERPAVEFPVIQLNDRQELRPSPPEVGCEQETTERRPTSGVAIRSWVGRNLLSSSLAIVLVVAVVFLTLTQLSLNNENSLNSVRTSALAAAKSYAVDLASYNYQHLDQDFGKVLAESTPAFKQNFTQSSQALKTAIVRYHGSASANVVGTGLASATTSRAVVLVFLNQTVDNTLQKSKPTSESRVEITLLRSGGRWLIDQVSLL